jgi:hypothetical protein
MLLSFCKDLLNYMFCDVTVATLICASVKLNVTLFFFWGGGGVVGMFLIFNHAWQVSVEDEKERQNRIAKMRSLLFRHETKAKHIKKIKSKTYHRLLKKDRLKTAAGQIEMDPEAAKEQAFKQEFKRAEVNTVISIFVERQYITDYGLIYV